MTCKHPGHGGNCTRSINNSVSGGDEQSIHLLKCWQLIAYKAKTKEQHKRLWDGVMKHRNDGTLPSLATCDKNAPKSYTASAASSSSDKNAPKSYTASAASSSGAGPDRENAAPQARPATSRDPVAPKTSSSIGGGQGARLAHDVPAGASASSKSSDARPSGASATQAVGEASSSSIKEDIRKPEAPGTPPHEHQQLQELMARGV